MIKKLFFFLTLTLLLSIFTLTLSSAEKPVSSIFIDYKSGVEQYREADKVLNEVKFATAIPDRAKVYVEKLETVLANNPGYPFRGEALYFLGVNYQVLGKYWSAISSFERALEIKPDLEWSTSVKGFIKSARFELNAILIFWSATFILSVVCLFVIFLGCKTKFWKRADKKYFKFSISLSVIWLILFFLLAFMDTSAYVTGVDKFPKPVLVNTKIGQIGDQVLWGLLVYGSFAILASAFIVLVGKGLSSIKKRVAFNLLASFVISVSLITLCYMQFCYQTAEHVGLRLNILVKELVMYHEIPDEMIPLYDEGLRKCIREERNKK